MKDLWLYLLMFFAFVGFGALKLGQGGTIELIIVGIISLISGVACIIFHGVPEK